jgi:hypothetical protein
VIEPPALGCETLTDPEVVGLGLVLAVPPLLHAEAITVTAILRLAVPKERSLNLMAFTYS